MLYIHKLADLNQHSADIESIPIIREIARKTSSLPVTAAAIEQYFADYSILPSEIEVIERAGNLVQPTSEAIAALIAESNPLHEPINLYRAVQNLQQLPAPLQNDIRYCNEIASFQTEAMTQALELINALPSLRTAEAAKQLNEKWSAFFQRILRHNEFSFNYQDIVYEAHTSLMNGLSESMAKGYFFKVTLNEEIAKTDFATIKLRIPPQELAKVSEIGAHIRQIKEGIDTAYMINMRMTSFAIILFSWMKFGLRSQQH